MAWKSLNLFINTMVGKTVRFKGNYATANLSNEFNINKTHPARVNIPAGALGVIYRVNMGTVFIGFGRDFKTAPARNGSPTYYGATIQLTIDDINKLEIEY